MTSLTPTTKAYAPSQRRTANSLSPKSSSATSTGQAVDHIFILWGENFFESAAVIFATMFREAGLCVKLVGVHGPQAVGHSSIVLQADLSVTAALALTDRVCAIVLPCSQAALRRLGNDPRLHQLFQQATNNGVCFFIPPDLPKTANSLKVLGVPPQLVIQYAEENALISFVQQFAPQLAALISAGEQQIGTVIPLAFAQPG